ncbi:MAG: hypothetical protein CVU49_06755 [Candidatus Cloacimonetes bacterium HGW-Cloacimonetes-2]|jgi:hypothetical protein|nr:MAG: hypothetical protein CVU49_06755 [Candidatus Cloacimonetes bacterium HGW-Cloacimonetes-2]
MRKHILVLVVLMALATWLSAHPASNVLVTYSNENHVLSLTISHQVRDAADHFISKVTVKVGNAEILTHKLTMQDSLTGGVLLYKLPGLASGSRITVITDCNKGGRKTAQITVR